MVGRFAAMAKLSCAGWASGKQGPGATSERGEQSRAAARVPAAKRRGSRQGSRQQDRSRDRAVPCGMGATVMM